MKNETSQTRQLTEKWKWKKIVPPHNIKFGAVFSPEHDLFVNKYPFKEPHRIAQMQLLQHKESCIFRLCRDAEHYFHDLSTCLALLLSCLRGTSPVVSHD